MSSVAEADTVKAKSVKTVAKINPFQEKKKQ